MAVETVQKTVIISVDNSIYSDKALEYYLEHLYKPDHKVVLVHAAEIPKIARPFHGVNIEVAEITDSMWQEAHEIREAELKSFHKHIEDLMGKFDHIEHEILITQYHHGHLGDSIVSLANDHNATFIVIGSRGLGTLRRTILGSVSDFVLRHAKCPVIICHFDAEKYHHHHVPKTSV